MLSSPPHLVSSGSWTRPHRCSAFRRTGSWATPGHRGGAFKEIERKRMSLPADEISSLSRKAVFVRYADDWVLLFTGTEESVIRDK